MDTRSCLHEAHARASAPGLPPSLEGQKEAVTGPARRLSVEQDERACLFSKEDSYEKCVRACVCVLGNGGGYPSSLRDPGAVRRGRQR